MNAKAIALIAGGLVAAAGVGNAIGDLGSGERERELPEVDVRKDDAGDDVDLVDDDDRDRDKGGSTGGSDRTGRADTRDRGDGDATRGNDGTGGGDNTDAAASPAPAPAPPAPAPAPAPAYDGGDASGDSFSGGGGSVSAGSDG